MGTLISITVRVLKLAIVFWPFFISIMFGGRPVGEVLKANRSFTVIFFLLLTIAFTLVVTTITLTNLRRDYSALYNKHRDLRVEVTAVKIQNQNLSDRLKMCIPSDYDPTIILDRLTPYLGE